MPWIYHQRSGELWLDEALVGDGYSGWGVGKNNPDMQSTPNLGPIPAAQYTIGPPYTDEEKGPIVMRLTPVRPNSTLGRSGFMIHGDSIKHPGQASEGCMIFDHPTRLQISLSDDKELDVQT